MNNNDTVPATMVNVKELRAQIQRAKSPNKAMQRPPAAAAQPPPQGDAVSSVTDDTSQPPAQVAASGISVIQQNNNNNNEKNKNKQNKEKENKNKKDNNNKKPTDSRLASAMPTIESQPQTMQPALTQATLRMLKLHESLINKKTGNLKLETDKDLIPNSVRLKPELQVVKYLQNDEESLRNKARFKEILAKTQKDLKDVMIRQNKRQIKVMTENLLTEFNKIIVDLSTLYVRYLTTKSEVTLATLVPPVIAAAATHCLFFCLDPSDELFHYLGSSKSAVLEHNKTKYLMKTTGIPIIGGIDNLFARKSQDSTTDNPSAEEKEDVEEEQEEQKENEEEEKEQDDTVNNTTQLPPQPPTQTPASVNAATSTGVQFRNPYARGVPGTIPNPATRGTPRTADTIRRAQTLHQAPSGPPGGFVPANAAPCPENTATIDTHIGQGGSNAGGSVPGPPGQTETGTANVALLTPDAAARPVDETTHTEEEHEHNRRERTHSPERLTFEGTPLYEADQPPYLSQALLSLVHKISGHLAALLEPLFLNPPKEIKETTLEKKALLDVAEGIRKQRAHTRGKDLSLALAEPAVADHPSMVALIDSRLDTKTKQQKNRERKQKQKEQQKKKNQQQQNEDQNQSKNGSEGGWGTPVDPAIAARATAQIRGPNQQLPRANDNKRAATTVLDLTTIPDPVVEPVPTTAPRHAKRPRFTEADFQAFLEFQEQKASNQNPYSTARYQTSYQGGRDSWGQENPWSRDYPSYQHHYSPRGSRGRGGRGRGRGFPRGRGRSRGRGHYHQYRQQEHESGGGHDDMSSV